MTHFSLVATAMLIAASVPTLSGAETFTYGNFDHDARTCAITAYDGADIESLTIPSIYKLEDTTYKVSKVEADVFHDLPSLTVVNIGPHLASIGYSDKLGSPRNFYSCPNLKLFAVDPSNQHLSVTSEGILVDNPASILIVPPHVATKGGLLQLPALMTRIGDDAFNGVSTVTTLSLGKDLAWIMNNGGLNKATSLKKFHIAPDNPNFTVIDDALLIKKYSSEGNAEVVSLAPCADITRLQIPASVTIAGKSHDISRFVGSACANCRNITSAVIDAPVSFLIGNTFYNCPVLREISFTQDFPCTIPSNFARDCPALREVSLPTPPVHISNSAFKGCRSLIRFPFNASTVLFGDSIFAGTGFDKVVIEGTIASGDMRRFPSATFAECRNLETIDMSAIQFENEPDNDMHFDYCLFEKGFAADTPRLKTFIAPRRSIMSRDIFGTSCDLRKIVLQNFDCSSKYAPFTYYADASPVLYAVTRNTWRQIKNPIGWLFAASPDVTLTPTVYCDAWKMVSPAYDSSSGLEIGTNLNPYYIPGATYYIPALASSNYKDVPEERLHEMFSIIPTAANDGKSTRLECRPLIDGLEFKAIYFKSKSYFPIGGIVELPDKPYEVSWSTIEVEYWVNDVLMKTTYSSAGVIFNQAGADDILADTSITVRLDGRHAVFNTAVEYTLTDIRGRVLARGEGQDADMSALPSGIYIINAHNPQDSITRKITF